MTVEPKSATITDVRDVRSFQPGRLGKVDKVILYSVGDKANYSVILPAEGFTDQAALDAVKKDAAERLNLVGRVVTL